MLRGIGECAAKMKYAVGKGFLNKVLLRLNFNEK